jgi:hypothetical protein
MSKKIEWKNSSIDYDKLNLTHNELQQITNGLNAVRSGQLLSIASKGGKVAGKKNYDNGTGLFGMSEEDKRRSQINGGKVAGKLASEVGTVVKAGQVSAKSPKHPNNVMIQCEHCGFETSLPLYKRWHGNNCKKKVSE